MTSRLEAYRVQAYNTAKLSENKMHDDTVAKRFGFSGGLVPGVDVMAYMIHQPVAKWGRAFLERGFIEARFVKPVYDGETADVTGEESNGVLSIEVESRGQLCATGSASLPASAPLVSISDFAETAAVAERRPVDATSYELGKWLGTVPRAWAGEAAKEYLTDIRERDPIYASEGLGHPGLLQRVMNRVLVDNAILGPWIHVGSRMQCSRPPNPATKSPRAPGSPAITKRRATASSNWTRSLSPMAVPRSPIASTSRSTSRASRQRRRCFRHLQIVDPEYTPASSRIRFKSADAGRPVKPGDDGSAVCERYNCAATVPHATFFLRP